MTTEAEMKRMPCPILVAASLMASFTPTSTLSSVKGLRDASYCYGSGCPWFRRQTKTKTADGQVVEFATDEVYCGMGGKP